jgi:hypothetical protein
VARDAFKRAPGGYQKAGLTQEASHSGVECHLPFLVRFFSTLVVLFAALGMLTD